MDKHHFIKLERKEDGDGARAGGSVKGGREKEGKRKERKAEGGGGRRREEGHSLENRKKAWVSGLILG